MKILKIMELFWRESDEAHPLSSRDIIRALEREGITAERKSIYRDIQTLQEYGMDIEKCGEKAGYFLASRTFELPELKLLVDAVAASKFITERKSRELVEKITRLASVYEGKMLRRQVVVSDRVKTANEGVYYAIDVIYGCIDHNHQMTFQYMEWDAQKRQVLRHGGSAYVVSPEFLLWDNEYYYLVAYDEKAAGIRHYRVDKIRHAKELFKERGGVEVRSRQKREDYARKQFGMFAGERKTVRLWAPLHFAGVMIDRFGTEVAMRPQEGGILVRAEVEISPQFFGWLTGLGNRVTLEGPTEVRDEYKRYLTDIMENYRTELL